MFWFSHLNIICLIEYKRFFTFIYFQKMNKFNSVSKLGWSILHNLRLDILVQYL